MSKIFIAKLSNGYCFCNTYSCLNTAESFLPLPGNVGILKERLQLRVHESAVFNFCLLRQIEDRLNGRLHTGHSEMRC